MNGLLSEYRLKQSTVEQQIQEIDKLNVVINALEKEMLELKGKYDRAIEDRNVTGVQLIDRNDELCILYERSNQQLLALKTGELLLMKKTEEFRFLRLQTEELRRQYAAARRRLPEAELSRNKMEVLEAQLVAERRKTESCSALLEDPNNIERWRPLEGEDPSFEQLAFKIKTLESRLDGKREQLLEKELVLEEITTLTNRLRVQAVAKRDSAKSLVEKLNDFQGKIRETTKKMLASVSELSMYQVSYIRSHLTRLLTVQRDPKLTLPVLFFSPPFSSIDFSRQRPCVYSKRRERGRMLSKQRNGVPAMEKRPLRTP